MASWLPLPRDQWDSLRVPVPGFDAKPNGAHYTISLAGIVRRSEDGLIWRPRSVHTKFGIPTSLIVRLGGGSNSFSLAKLMHTAFAESSDLPSDDPRDPDRSIVWSPWLRYDAPHEPITGERSCSIANIVLAPFGQLVSFTRGNSGAPPETREFAAIGRDVPIPRQRLLDAGYVFRARYAELVVYGQRVEIDKVHIE
jgi:hypothetical protein